MIQRKTMTTQRQERAARIGRQAAVVTMAWGVTTAALTASWALGGTLGLDQLGSRIQEQAVDRETGFVAMIWLSAVGRLLVAALGLSLWFGRERSVPRRALLAVGWLAGLGLTLYGVAGIGQAALALGGAIATPASMGEAAVPWYLFLWEPLWLTGGLSLLVATAGYQIGSRPSARFRWAARDIGERHARHAGSHAADRSWPRPG